MNRTYYTTLGSKLFRYKNGRCDVWKNVWIYAMNVVVIAEKPVTYKQARKLFPQAFKKK